METVLCVCLLMIKTGQHRAVDGVHRVLAYHAWSIKSTVGKIKQKDNGHLKGKMVKLVLLYIN